MRQKLNSPLWRSKEGTLKKRIVVGVAFATLLALASTYAQTTQFFVYVANSGSNNVSAYTVNTGTGALSAVEGSPFSSGRSPHGVAVDPTEKYIYVANYGGNTVSASRSTRAPGHSQR